jgi:hypothetical protein
MKVYAVFRLPFSHLYSGHLGIYRFIRNPMNSNDVWIVHLEENPRHGTHLLWISSVESNLSISFHFRRLLRSFFPILEPLLNILERPTLSLSSIQVQIHSQSLLSSMVFTIKDKMDMVHSQRISIFRFFSGTTVADY